MPRIGMYPTEIVPAADKHTTACTAAVFVMSENSTQLTWLVLQNASNKTGYDH